MAIIKIDYAEISIGTERFRVPEYEGTVLKQSEIENYRDECYAKEEKTLGTRVYVNEMDKKTYSNYKLYFRATEVKTA